MTTTTPTRGARIYIEIDQEAADALDRVARDVRLNRHAFIRATLVKALRDAGALASAIQETAR